jgi:putative two-component system response regulator
MVTILEERAMDSHTILVVDDMPENIELLADILLPHYRVRVANSGVRALEAAKKDPRPNLILLDVMMPEMDGYEVLQLLRTDERTRNIPVVFVTALDSDIDEVAGLYSGASDYIPKPVRPPIVLARVRTQIELASARELLRVENAALEVEIQRRMRQNLVVQDVAMRALACLAEARDADTGRHLMRTQHYVRFLAEELASHPQFQGYLTPERIELFVKAAPLHDIGKVGIPDHILHKPAKLTPQEWDVMKTHSKIGADAIRRAVAEQSDKDGLDFLEVAAEIAEAHHEKWDGSGYPAGLVGEAIPLSARLMAVADVFDALSSKRVYKEAFDFERAFSIVTEGRGSHFDPKSVDAFLARAEDFKRIAFELADAPS